MARRLYELVITSGPRNEPVARLTAHLDVQGDQDELEATLQRHLINEATRQGSTRPEADARLYKLRVRRPGWHSDEIPPYVIPGGVDTR